MKRVVFGLLLCVLGTYSHAEWVKVSDSSDGKVNYYVDPSSIRKTGTTMQALTLTDYQEPQVLSGTQRYLSAKMLDEFNCAERTGQHLNLTVVSENLGAGKVVAAEKKPAGWRRITPNTADEDMWAFVCEKK